MSDNPEKIAELQNDKLVELLRSKSLGPPVCRHIEAKGHNGQQFIKPEYVIETFPSVEYLRSIKLLKAQIRTLVSVRKELHVETSTVPYLETSAAASSSSPSTTTSGTTLTAEETEKLLQEAAPLLTNKKYSEAISLYSKVVDIISINEADASLKQILSRALSNRSGCFLGLKKSKNALVDARRCVDVRPSWIRSHLRVAKAAEELEEFDVAIAAYQAAIKAEDRSGNVPSQEELESDVLRVQQKQFKSLMKKIDRVSPTNVRDTLISAVKYCTSAESAHSFCLAIASLTFANVANKILFGTAAVRDAIVAVSKYCTTEKSASSFCLSIGKLAENENNEVLFGTAAVRDAIVARSKYCTAPPSAGSFCSSIVKLAANKNNRIIFGTASFRDALLAVSKYCTYDDSANSFCSLIGSLAFNNNNRILFGTASVRDALVAVSKYCASPGAAADLCGAIENIIDQNESNAVLFATEATRDAILSASSNIDYYYGVYSCCRVISLFHKTKPTLFCVKQTVTSLVKLSKVAIEKQSAKSIYWFLNVVLTLLHSDEKLFNTPEIRVAVERFQEVVNDREKVKKLEKRPAVVDALSDEEYLDKARQLCVEFRKVVNEKSVASSSAAAACVD